MSRIRVGVVGAGFSGMTHLRALRQLPEIEVVAVADQAGERARKAAAEHNVPMHYGDCEAMLRGASIDALHNCTPNHAHAEVTAAALASGIHVLSEKPLGMDCTETQTLASTAASSDLVTGVCFNYRYYPLVREMRAILESDRIGTPHLIHGSYLQDWLLLDTDWNWRLEASKSGASRAFADIGSHWIDLVQFVTGDLVEDVCANLGTLHARRQRPGGEVETFASSGPMETEAVQIDTEDFACIIIRFASGCQGVLTVSQVSAGHKNGLSVEIDARHGSLRWNQEAPNTLWIGHRQQANELLLRDPSIMDSSASALSRQPAGHPEGWLDTFVNLFSDFYGAIAAKRDAMPYSPLFASFADAHRIEKTVEAVLSSAHATHAVRIDAGDAGVPQSGRARTTPSSPPNAGYAAQ